MDRRTFVSSLALGIAAAPLAAEGQQAGKVARIGYLSASSTATTGTADLRRAFSESLRDLLVRLKMDVIVAAGAVPVIRAAKHATSTIPIIMVIGTDPVGQGFISSFQRPGGNITGVTWDADPAIYGKYPELLKDMIPKLSRVGAIRDPLEPYVYRKAVEDAAARLGLTMRHVEVRSLGELEEAFATITRWRAQAVIVYGSSLFRLHLPQIVSWAAKHKLPATSVWREAVPMGILMSYGVNIADLFRRAAAYVDKILKGATPATLPVEQPTKFELVLNAKTAKALRLTIPPSIMIRATEVIE